jgi:acetylornithine deacetylase/succinyl-diaminopimelate desuccinylase family protein
MSCVDVIDTLCDLIRINSINPAYSNGRNEEEIQHYISGFFGRAGIATEWQQVSPGRANVVAKLKGRNPDRRLVLEAHVDTAGIDNMTVSPFEPELRDGRLYGRGACDTKGGLAAMMHAVLAVHRSGTVPPGDVWLAAVVDEEHSYRGVLRLCEGLSATGAIVAEPTDLRVVVASKGCLRWRVTVTGRAAHSSKPHLGVNAITRMARFIVALEEEEQHLKASRHPLVGSPTINVGVIQGGAQVNIVPDECFVEIDRRLIPGETLSEVQHRYEMLPETLRKQFPDLDVSQSPLISDWPMETSTDAEIVRIACGVLKDAQLDPEPVGVPFGSDASKLVRIGVPSIVLGPGSIDQAHTADEFVPADEVVKAAGLYEQIIRRF